MRERELEDLAALINLLGGSASLFGHSSGGVLALEAAMLGMSIERLVISEAPYTLEGTRPIPPAALFDRLCALVREGRREDAAALFYAEAVGLPSAAIDRIRAMPSCGGLLALAHTLPYDIAAYSDSRLPVDRLTTLGIPTLAIDGRESFRGFARPRAPWRPRFRRHGTSHSQLRTTSTSCSTLTRCAPSSAERAALVAWRSPSAARLRDTGAA